MDALIVTTETPTLISVFALESNKQATYSENRGGGGGNSQLKGFVKSPSGTEGRVEIAYQAKSNRLTQRGQLASVSDAICRNVLASPAYRAGTAVHGALVELLSHGECDVGGPHTGGGLNGQRLAVLRDLH